MRESFKGISKAKRPPFTGLSFDADTSNTFFSPLVPRFIILDFHTVSVNIEFGSVIGVDHKAIVLKRYSGGDGKCFAQA